ncbi:MAG: hypothetical protein ABI811_17105 [Acidobacteriota bacterium]
MDSPLFKHVLKASGWVSLLAVLGGTLWIGLQGLSRSLWLDEAWVANSVRAATLGDMFWRSDWLQTSPPLFLLAARAAIRIFGLSTETLRSVPLVFALISAGALIAAARRVAPSFAMLAGAALIFPAISLEYFLSFKQYGCEAAAAALILAALSFYIVEPRLGFVPLFCVVFFAAGLSYSSIFLLPGVLLAVYRTEGKRHTLTLAAGSGIAFALLYFLFIQPNVEPSLWQYWRGGFSEAYTPGVWVWIGGTAALTLYALRSPATGRQHLLRQHLLLACLLPGILLVIAELTGWYPASPRTRLFIRPCFILAVAMVLEDFAGRAWRWAPVAANLAALIVVMFALPIRLLPLEDYPPAIAYLREHVGPNDLLLVHPDALEGFRLYSAMAHWDPPMHAGSTGWPCCPRGSSTHPDFGPSSEARVDADLARKISPDFSGRVWLFYANRPLHWKYIGLDEGDLWRRRVWDRGCPPVEYIALPNLVIAPMQCGAKSP